MHVSLTRLRHILAVARTGSFSLAAEEEGISQPALSRSIQAFEAEYEVRLFDRSRGGATLTAAGALAVEHARNVLAAAGELDRNMSLIGKGEAGRVGVGFGPLVASLLLPGLGKQQPDTGQRSRTGERVGHECRAVHKCPGLASGDATADTRCAEGCGECHIAPGEGLSETQNIRHDVRMLQREHFPGAAEAGGDLIENQQDIVLVAKRAQLHKVLR